jgi:hypothetical protein
VILELLNPSGLGYGVRKMKTKSKQINWKSTQADAALCLKIAQRADRELKHQDMHSTLMDIKAVHLNSCRMDLVALLAADKFNFAHDVLGIYRHIDRKTAELRDFFVPRFAAKESVKLPK